MLPKLSDKIGLVEQSIYLFGLKDHEEYEISSSSNFMDSVQEFLLLNGLDWNMTEGIGCNRIGISYSLRQTRLSGLILLIKR